ncbi:hypothetical protein BDD12DRAFT_806689 [Trichophaea hybrida]|nr:hypothetical protein BDD12DRAFT_806689 [Trichophaea hybrida]
MTGFEVAGIVLSVLPLIIIAFDRIQTFLAEYDGLDQQLQRSRRDILTIQGLFKDAIKSLLSDVLEQDRRERMLKNPQSEDWNLGFLDEDQRTVLGEALQPVLNSIEGFKEATQEYEGVLLDLCKAHPMKRLAKTIASTTSAIHITTSGSGSGVRIDDSGAKILKTYMDNPPNPQTPNP